MPSLLRRTAIFWRSAARILAVAGSASLAAAAPPSDVFAQGGAVQGTPDKPKGGAADQHTAIRDAAQKAITASRTFVAQSKDVYKSGNAPRQSDPAIGSLLDSVFGVDILRKTDASDEDGDSVAEWLLAAIHVGSVYVGAGTGITNPALMVKDTKARERSDRNVVDYAPEIGRYMDSQVVLETALFGTISTGGPEADNPALQKAVDQMRSGLEMSVNASIGTLAVAGLSYDWRLARLAVLQSVAPKLATFLDRARCEKLHKTVATVSARLHDSRVTDQLAAFDGKLSCSKG